MERIPVFVYLLIVTSLLLKNTYAVDETIPCPTLEPPRNGTVSFATRDWKGNQMAHFTCDEGYILVGSSELECDNYTWSADVPHCGVTDCQTHYLAGAQADGMYGIIPDGRRPITVQCDMTTAGGGWTVFQQRLNNFSSFYKYWYEYMSGFGDDKGNLWLGLDTIHHMTWDKSELYVEIEDTSGKIMYAQYGTFQVSGEEDDYRLTVRDYSGNAGDALKLHNQQRFSTRNRDNDGHFLSNKAQEYHGAWWYSNGYTSNLNGRYEYTDAGSRNSAIPRSWRGDTFPASLTYHSVKRCKMMLR